MLHKKTGYLPVFVFVDLTFACLCAGGAFSILRSASSNGIGSRFFDSFPGAGGFFFMFNIYIDESCKDAHRHLVVGGIGAEFSDLATIEEKLKAIRVKHNTFGEVKWTKTSRAKLQFYKEFVDVFFDFAKQDKLHFKCLHIDTSTIEHEADTTLNKLIYQLLLHRFGKTYGDTKKLYVLIDKRSTVHSPISMRPMLNADLKKSGIYTNAFQHLAFINSKDSPVMQLNDLIIGAIGFRKNGYHLREVAAPHKCELAVYIGRRALELGSALQLYSRHEIRFAIWKFEFQTKTKKF